MQLIPIIMDSRPPYLADDAHGSLLSLPFGTGTVLGALMDRVTEAGGTGVRVLPVFRADEAYIRSLTCSHDVEVVTAAQLAALLHASEPSDDLLIIDPRYWPINGLDVQALIEGRDDRRWALHAVAVGSDNEQMQEYIRCDESGYVRCIRRYYQSVTWPKTGPICATLVPVSAAEDVTFASLLELRNLLALRGMLSRDVHVAGGCADLTDERDLLMLQEEVVATTVAAAGRAERKRESWFSPRSEYRLIGSGVLSADDARIHPSARLAGPILIQKGAEIAERVTIIGPSLIGARARLGPGAFIAAAVVCPDVQVGPLSSVRHRLLSAGPSAMPRSMEGEESLRTRRGPDGHARPPISISKPTVAGWMLQRTERSTGRRIYPTVKLVVEVAAALVSLLVLAPLFMVIAILIKLDSPGPVFFLDRREGKGGKIFNCIKFRTMFRDAHLVQRSLYTVSDVDGPQFKLANDPRITRIGRWLRLTNLDELPQLINVVLGQMSLVGPRPSPFRENQICIPWRRARLSVRPGITGMWQVCRHDREEADFHQWIAYDIAYVRNQSLMVDLRILAATILTLGGRWSVSESWLLGRGSAMAS